MIGARAEAARGPAERWVAALDEARMPGVWARISAIARAQGEPVSVVHACEAYAEALGAFGASLSMSRGNGGREPVLATGERSAELSELQFTLGQGPCMDAATSGESVLVADLDTDASRVRWPIFAPAAVLLRARGVFCLPIQAGAARLGVLDLYRERPGPLTGEQLTLALTYADALLILILDERVGIASHRGSAFETQFIERRAVVHQATGMVSAQLGIGVSDALARLRAHAYINDEPLGQVSADVVERRIQFRPETGAVTPTTTEDGEASGLGAAPEKGNNENRGSGPLPGAGPADEEGTA